MSSARIPPPTSTLLTSLRPGSISVALASLHPLAVIPIIQPSFFPPLSFSPSQYPPSSFFLLHHSFLCLPLFLCPLGPFPSLSARSVFLFSLFQALAPFSCYLASPSRHYLNSFPSLPLSILFPLPLPSLSHYLMVHTPPFFPFLSSPSLLLSLYSSNPLLQRICM